MARRFIIYILLLALLCSILFSTIGCQQSEGRDSGSGIWGRIRSIGSQIPINGVKVSLDGLNIFGVTDSTGYFRIDGIPAGNYTAQFFRYDSIVSKIEFAISQEQADNGDLIQLLWPGVKTGSGSINGGVTDESGKPLVSAMVLLGRPDQNLQVAYTDENGGYLFANLQVSETYAVVVDVDEYVPQTVSVGLGPEGVGRVNFDMLPDQPPALPWGVVKGNVVDGDGIPLIDAYALIYPKNSMAPVFETASESSTDQSGKFDLGEIIEGPYILWVGKGGYGVKVQEIYVTAGLTWDSQVVLNGTYGVEL